MRGKLLWESIVYRWEEVVDPVWPLFLDRPDWMVSPYGSTNRLELVTVETACRRTRSLSFAAGKHGDVARKAGLLAITAYSP